MNRIVTKIRSGKKYNELILWTKSGVVVSKFSKEDLPKVEAVEWSVFKTKRQIYVRSVPSHGRVFLHNVVVGELSKGMFADHVNGDTLDNRRGNLRAVDKYQNMWNRKTNSNTTTGAKGVTWFPDRKKWQARIGFRGKRISLGYFISKEEAIKARSKKERDLYGNFSRK